LGLTGPNKSSLLSERRMYRLLSDKLAQRILEQKETIESSLMEDVAKTLKVPIDAIKNFNEEAAVNIIANTINNHDSSSGPTINYNPIFNPIEKWIEALSKNENLYERLLQTEREKVALLEKLLAEKKK